MTQQCPTKLMYMSLKKPIDTKSTTKTSTIKAQNIDEAYKSLFAALFKIKDKDVQRRVLEAVNGQNMTCSLCSNKIVGVSKVNGYKSSNQDLQNKQKCSVATQTIIRDFEFLERINNPTKIIETTRNECSILNKITLGRSKRKIEPYATDCIKTEQVSLANNQTNYLTSSSSPGSLLNKIKKAKIKDENGCDRLTPCKEYSISEKLLLEYMESPTDTMTPHCFFDLKSNEQQTKQFNGFTLLSTMEEEMRTADICNDGGLFPIHAAVISGDQFKLKRQMVIYKYRNWDVNIRSEEEKKETPLHYAVTSDNKEAIYILLDNGADVLSTNDGGDTVLHYAAEYISDVNIFGKLLHQIRIDDLCKQNDKSKTILHVAAIHKKPEFVRLILNFIDKTLNIVSIGEGVKDLKRLHVAHSDYIKNFIDESFRKPVMDQNKALQKSKILNQRDGRSGKTAIFFSVCNDDMYTSFMLIAHFADTRIPDLSGMSCAIYSTEILKNRILGQAIYNADAMHNAVIFKTLRQIPKSRAYNRKRGSSDIEAIDDSDDGDIMAKVAKVLS